MLKQTTFLVEWFMELKYPEAHLRITIKYTLYFKTASNVARVLFYISNACKIPNILNRSSAGDPELCQDLRRNNCSAWASREDAWRGQFRVRPRLETQPVPCPLSAWLPVVFGNGTLNSYRSLESELSRTGRGQSQKVTRHFMSCCFDTCHCANVFSDNIVVSTQHWIYFIIAHPALPPRPIL